MTDESAVKEAKVMMRRVQDHLYHAHQRLGAQSHSLGFVDVIYHPSSTLATLNYVTPRKNTAWVSGNHIETGLNFLRENDRIPRVCFIEGLYPPIFARSLRELGLRLESEMPIMVRNAQPFKIPTIPEGITIHPVSDQQGLALWWYIWRNAYYEVITPGVEPLFIGRDMRDLVPGNILDLILYRHGFPVGVARLTRHKTSAHILALAIMKEAKTTELERFLQVVALQTAMRDGADFVFVSGDAEADRQHYRELAFIDSGSVVCYAENRQNERYEKDDESLAQPVLVI